LRTVRADEDLKSIPVILLSARAGEESRVEGLDAGADDYLVKPFSARELVARVGSSLAMAKMRRESTEKFRALSEHLDAEVRARTKELEERSNDLLKQSQQMRELSRRLLQTQDEERRHISRELHDSAGQTLAVLGMNLAQLLREARGKDPAITKRAEAAEQIVQQLQQEIRTASYLLHPPLLDEIGLASALEWYTQGLSDRSGVNITLKIPRDFGRIPREIELVIFRLVQECLTNIHRHSGAKNAVIYIWRVHDIVSIEVSDDGRGMPGDKLAEVQRGGSGVGIGGMRERVRQFQGEMKIESDSSGTKIFVTIPGSQTTDGT
jgi:signal transduction histidine kinase